MLADPPPPSYAVVDLTFLAVRTYWPSLLLALTLSLLPSGSDRHGPPPRLFSTLPFLVWALQSSLDLQACFGLPGYFLWHRLFVTLVALSGLVAVVSVLAAVDRYTRSAPASWPSPVWSIAVVAAPLIDWMAVILFSSPISCVFGSERW